MSLFCDPSHDTGYCVVTRVAWDETCDSGGIENLSSHLSRSTTPYSMQYLMAILLSGFSFRSDS